MKSDWRRTKMKKSESIVWMLLLRLWALLSKHRISIHWSIKTIVIVIHMWVFSFHQSVFHIITFTWWKISIFILCSHWHRFGIFLMNATLVSCHWHIHHSFLFHFFPLSSLSLSVSLSAPGYAKYNAATPLHWCLLCGFIANNKHAYTYTQLNSITIFYITLTHCKLHFLPIFLIMIKLFNSINNVKYFVCCWTRSA